MYYTRKETYMYVIPKEYRAYLKFKQELKDAGITFTEEGGSTHQEIVIYTRGSFDKSKEDENVDSKSN